MQEKKYPQQTQKEEKTRNPFSLTAEKGKELTPLQREMRNKACQGVNGDLPGNDR